MTKSFLENATQTCCILSFLENSTQIFLILFLCKLPKLVVYSKSHLHKKSTLILVEHFIGSKILIPLGLSQDKIERQPYNNASLTHMYNIVYKIGSFSLWFSNLIWTSNLFGQEF